MWPYSFSGRSQQDRPNATAPSFWQVMSAETRSLPMQVSPSSSTFIVTITGSPVCRQPRIAARLWERVVIVSASSRSTPPLLRAKACRA